MPCFDHCKLAIISKGQSFQSAFWL